VTNLSTVEASILLSRCINVHGLALSTKDYSRPSSLVLLGWFGAWFVSDYRVMEEVSAPTFKAELFFCLFVIPGDAKDDVLVSLVRVRPRLRSDNLMDVLSQNSSFQKIYELLVGHDFAFGCRSIEGDEERIDGLFFSLAKVLELVSCLLFSGMVSESSDELFLQLREGKPSCCWVTDSGFYCQFRPQARGSSSHAR
jgi:hypothetical protein